MSTQTSTSLRISRVVDADPGTVFRAWTDPKHLMRWACPEGATVGEAQVDLRVGGRYRLRIEGAEGEVHTATGVYREIDPPRRLSYTWDWEEAEHRMGVETLVTVELSDLGDSTEIVLTHEGFPAPEAREGHDQGWTSCVVQLERFLATT